MAKKNLISQYKVTMQSTQLILSRRPVGLITSASLLVVNCVMSPLVHRALW